MSDKTNPFEERVLDVLLSEVHGASGPRDFSHDIVTHLNDDPVASAHFVATSIRVSKSPVRSKKSAQWAWIPLVVAIAASLLLAVLFRASKDLEPNIGPSNADNFESVATVPAQLPERGTVAVVERVVSNSPAVSPDDFPSHGFEPVTRNLAGSGKLSGVPLASESLPAGTSTRFPDAPEKARAAKPVLELQPVRLVSQHVGEDIRAYWRSLNIEPTADASAEVVAARIAMTLGVEVSGDVVGDIERLTNQLSRPAEAASITNHWLNELTMNGFDRMSEEDREQLTSVFSSAIVNRKGFDTVIADLIAGRSPSSSSWYNAMASHGEAAMHHRLASVSMNTDLRCTRCHDASIEGKGLQQDHWAFVALLRSRVRLNEEERWEVLSRDAVQGDRRNFFYDLPDGRRRLVQPAVAPQWMGMDSSDAASDLDQWADDLIGSRPLADGLVNSLWRTLHGRSLIGSDVDVATSPEPRSLLRTQTEFSDDLIASGFDIARSVALMIHSPAFQRTVPNALQPQTTLMASRTQIEQAHKLVDAYAAAPARSSIGISQKVAHVLRAAGSKIDLAEGDSAMILGQADDVTPKRKLRSPITDPRRSKLPADFPTDADNPPVVWLDQVNQLDAKVEHLAYLAGRSGVPEPVINAVDAMRRAKTDQALVLQRAWWLLSK